MNLPEGSSDTLSQLGEGNFTSDSTFLSYVRRKKEENKNNKKNQNKTKQKIKVNREEGFQEMDWEHCSQGKA